MNTNVVQPTVHSINKVKERCGIKNKHSAVKNIELALQRGKRYYDFSSWESSYLKNSVHNDCFAVAYNNYCYIFSEEKVCITLFELPAWFGKKKRFDGKEKIKHCKRYLRSRTCLDERNLQ